MELICYRKWNKRLARVFDSLDRKKEIEFQKRILEKERQTEMKRKLNQQSIKYKEI